ncbi:hypothetical protein ScPMuIL_015672 [Solemya velum]
MDEHTVSLPVFFIFAFTFCISSSFQDKANIVFILTDDQDAELGGQIPMTKTTNLSETKESFSTTHMCLVLCAVLAGRTKQEPTAFAAYLKSQGYNTFFAGKYLNQYGMKAAGGVQHVPTGWDSWLGLVGNSRYYNYTLSNNGKEEKHGSDYSSDYLTDLINRHATDFLKNQNPHGRSFFMMLSTPACHAPFTPAPQYTSNFTNKSAPRGGNSIFRNRWRTLLSVDDMVENVVNLLSKQGLLDNTYIFFSSDNGYHLGQFSLPYDKRQLYQFDVRVPLMIRGPGIKPGQTIDDLVQSIDLAPTFVELSGHPPPKDMDGKSLLPLLHPSQNTTGPFRKTALIEHQGEMEQDIPGCPQYKNQWMANCPTRDHCVCEDSWNNTYGCVVEISTTTYKYCELQDSENFVEVYDLKKDPNEMNNLAKSLNPKLLRDFHRTLVEMAMCGGADCYNSTKTSSTIFQ